MGPAGDHLTETPHWEANFKMVKARGREVGAIDNFVKVDCITVSTAPVKAAVEGHAAPYPPPYPPNY